MYGITVNSVSQGLVEGLRLIRDFGTEKPSRNGPVIRMTEPVIVKYTRPMNRVLFSPMRNANPFFHLMESLWMLAGRNDVAFPAHFAKQIRAYSDDGKTQWGAYGHRWREFFQYDQLEWIVDELTANPESRRCVLGMWNAMDLTQLQRVVPCDLYVATHGGKDVPCNTHAYFEIVDDALNMTVCNRSNDLLWGAFGANAVHFSVLMEYMAAAIGVPVGIYYQMTNNLHLYTNVLARDKIAAMEADVEATDYYRPGGDVIAVTPEPLIHHAGMFLEECESFVKNPQIDDRYTNPFFELTAGPAYRTWEARKNPDKAMREAERIYAEDWRIACRQWVERYEERRVAKAAQKNRAAVAAKDSKENVQ